MAGFRALIALAWCAALGAVAAQDIVLDPVFVDPIFVDPLPIDANPLPIDFDPILPSPPASTCEPEMPKPPGVAEIVVVAPSKTSVDGKERDGIGMRWTTIC